MAQDEEDRALLAWLNAGRDAPDEAEDLRPTLGVALPQKSEPADSLDETLRAMGMNYKEREAFRRKNAPKSNWRSSEKHRKTTVKRYMYAIAQRVNWSTVDLEPSYVAGVWAEITGYELELAEQWWSAGLSPLKLEQLVQLSERGFGPADLALRIGSKSLIEHMRQGSSMEWCLNALQWSKRPPQAS